MRAALNRRMDRAMINAFFKDSKTGETGTTTTSFTAGNIVAQNFEASGNVGLTIAKLIEAKRILRAAEVDTDYEAVYCAIGAKQEANLFHEIQYTNRDYSATMAPLVQG